MSAFSYEVKREVKERAGGYVSEFSKRSDRPPEFIHKIHGRDPRLNVPENCILTNDMEHLAYHLYFYERAPEIGLSKKQNIWSINKIAERVTQFSYAKGLLHLYDEDLSACLNGWELYFEEQEQPLVMKQMLLQFS